MDATAAVARPTCLSCPSTRGDLTWEQLQGLGLCRLLGNPCLNAPPLLHNSLHKYAPLCQQAVFITNVYFRCWRLFHVAWMETIKSEARSWGGAGRKQASFTPLSLAGTSTRAGRCLGGVSCSGPGRAGWLCSAARPRGQQSPAALGALGQAPRSVCPQLPGRVEVLP